MKHSYWACDEFNKVVHSSGFAVTVFEGSFAVPYRVGTSGRDDLPPIEYAAMQREGLAYGANLEHGKTADASLPLASSKEPTITYRRRRSIARSQDCHRGL